MWADRKTANEDEGNQTERYRDREKGKRMRLQYEEEVVRAQMAEEYRVIKPCDAGVRQVLHIFGRAQCRGLHEREPLAPLYVNTHPFKPNSLPDWTETEDTVLIKHQ